MTSLEEKVIPYLFMVLFGFIIVNLVINFCLFSFTKIKNIKILCLYWGSLLLTFIVQGQFQEGQLPVTLSFSMNLIPVSIIAKILFDSLEKSFPIKKYITLWLIGVAAALVLTKLDQGFSVSAFPLCAALAVPLMESAILALYTKRDSTSVLQKFMGFVYFIGGIHIINFALFRMVPGNQIWGWGAAFALYQILSISLLAFAFEEYSRKEQVRLQELVEKRTEELSQALQVKDTLFKVVLHDIANPIQGQVWILEKLKKEDGAHSDLFVKLGRLTNLIKEVIGQVRSIELLNSGKMSMDLRPVKLQQCLDDAYLVFEGALKRKQLDLVIENELDGRIRFLADQNSFTNSVLCNLISNAIKFSQPNSTLRVSAFEREGKVVVEVEDQGIGIPREMTFSMFDPLKKTSRVGTFGEKGTGYGLPLVKSFIDYFGGEIEVESRPMDMFPLDHGTKVTLTLEKTLGHLQ